MKQSPITKPVQVQSGKQVLLRLGVFIVGTTILIAIVKMMME